jgi:putative lipoic acid-binding regulatory protein
MFTKAAGTFFNPVPEEEPEKNADEGEQVEESFENNVAELLRKRNAPPLASKPSTFNGVPTSQAFTSPNASKDDPKPFVGIGPPLNDVSNPQYDDQGYTLYADEKSGKVSRVFEALVDYPTDFTMKIVGQNESTFVSEMVALVAESCEVAIDAVSHSERINGKWISITVKAPVQSAEMLYSLYENVDKDPRVKFKF